MFQRVEQEEKDIDLYWVDGEHASPYGSYVIAACAFARITGKSPVGLPYRSICSVPMDREMFAQVSELRRQAEAEADAAKKEALTAEANRLSAEAFTPIYDREKLWIELDPDKAARLQKIIAEEIAKYDAAHQG